MTKQEIIDWIVCEVDFIKRCEDNEKLIKILEEGFKKYDEEIKND